MTRKERREAYVSAIDSLLFNSAKILSGRELNDKSFIDFANLLEKNTEKFNNHFSDFNPLTLDAWDELIQMIAEGVIVFDEMLYGTMPEPLVQDERASEYNHMFEYVPTGGLDNIIPFPDTTQTDAPQPPEQVVLAFGGLDGTPTFNFKFESLEAAKSFLQINDINRNYCKIYAVRSKVVYDLVEI